MKEGLTIMQELMTQPAVSTRETYVPTREPSMKREFNAYAASGPKGRLEPFSFDPGPLEPEDVEIKVTHCGLPNCRSVSGRGQCSFSRADGRWRDQTEAKKPRSAGSNH